MSIETVAAPVGFAPEEIDQSASTRDVPLKWVVVVDEALPARRAVNAAISVVGPRRVVDKLVKGLTLLP